VDVAFIYKSQAFHDYVQNNIFSVKYLPIPAWFARRFREEKYFNIYHFQKVGRNKTICSDPKLYTFLS